MKLNIIKITPYIFYLLIIIFIFQFRSSLDSSKPFIASDGAIKLYQSVQYKEKGFFSLTCPYLGEEFDPEFKHFPISYPWVIFGTPEKCVFEYPPFFYWVGSLFLLFTSFPISSLLYIPLVFFCFNLIFFDYILKKVGLKSTVRVFFVIISFISFPLLTAMDYTESPAFQTFYLIGFYLFWKIIHLDKNNISGFLYAGIFFGISFTLRLEILMTFSFLCLCYFLFTREFKKSFFVYLGFSLVATLFVIYNLKVSGHPLGFRYVSSINFNENASADIWKRITLVRATVWGNEVMVGIFKFQPLIWILFVLSILTVFEKRNLQATKIFLAAGWISMLVIPFYVTVYGGVGYFGLRYIEAPFFLILLGASSYLSEKKFTQKKILHWISIFILIIAGYYNWLATKEGLKILKNSSKENIELQSFFEKSNRFIIHSSLYTSIWIGKSFFEKIHTNLTGNEETKAFLDKIPTKEKFVFLLSPEKIYISEDIPRSLHFRYTTLIDLNVLPVKILEEKKINGVKLVLVEKN